LSHTLNTLSKNIYNLRKKNTFLKKSIKLDSYFKNSRTPDVLWIDTQGSELLVLYGATKILNKVSLLD
jgi:FkbM family methyltransferase